MAARKGAIAGAPPTGFWSGHFVDVFNAVLDEIDESLERAPDRHECPNRA
ncbi:MAG TPA: hypothetical protein VH300_13135 [Thermoleophilaceae bacterium]|jgi:hypothetical protein|nr:hypothetical protein [Thermoleophilaceae bacterium]